MGTLYVPECSYMVGKQLDDQEAESSDSEPEVLARPVNYDAVAESIKGRKYLYDGLNMIQIKPTNVFKRKLIIGKAVALHDKISHKLDSAKISLTERTAGTFSGDLQDYVPDKSRYGVPDILYLCIQEIERRDPVSKQWLYRTHCRPRGYGEDVQMKKIKRSFLRGKVPQLHKYDLNAITWTVLSFLDDLRDKVIPWANREEFYAVAELPSAQEKTNRLIEIVAALPAKNQTTLGFLVMHMQEVAKCPMTNMPLKGLAAVFGPLVVGASCPRERMWATDAMFALSNMPLKYFGNVFYGIE